MPKDTEHPSDKASNPAARFHKPDENSFVGLLHAILNSKGASIRLAAKHLQIDKTQLAAMLKGTAPPPNRQTIRRKNWCCLLARHYPEGWRRYAAAFEKACQSLLSSPKRRRHSPALNETNFGAALWLLLGGKNADFPKACRLLKLTSSKLNSFLAGHGRPNKQFIEQRRWRAVLMKHFPDRWQRFGPFFDQALSSLPDAPGRIPRRPKDGSTGAILWMIIGASNTQTITAARRLNCDLRLFKHILFKGRPLERAYVEANGWIPILEASYPAFALHKAIFLTSLT